MHATWAWLCQPKYILSYRSQNSWANDIRARDKICNVSLSHEGTYEATSNINIIAFKRVCDVDVVATWRRNHKKWVQCACPMPGGEGMVGCEGDSTVSLYQGPISLFYMLHSAPLTCHFLEGMDRNRDTWEHILNAQSKCLCSQHTSAHTGVPIKECGQCHAGITWKATSTVESSVLQW